MYYRTVRIILRTIIINILTYAVTYKLHKPDFLVLVIQNGDGHRIIHSRNMPIIDGRLIWDGTQ